jgi:hypothetical protein
MRSHHVAAVIVVLLVGIGVKQFFFPQTTAEADVHAVKTYGMDISQMHVDRPDMKALPMTDATMHDMTFVFSDKD